jgi:hypothetical protein
MQCSPFFLDPNIFSTLLSNTILYTGTLHLYSDRRLSTFRRNAVPKKKHAWNQPVGRDMLRQLRWRQYVSPKRRSAFASLHDTVHFVFTAVRTSISFPSLWWEIIYVFRVWSTDLLKWCYSTFVLSNSVSLRNSRRKQKLYLHRKESLFIFMLE